MNRFRTFMPILLVKRGLLVLGVLIPLFAANPIFAQSTSQPDSNQTIPSTPLLKGGSFIYADIDTMNSRLLVLVEEGLWQYSLADEQWSFLTSLDDFTDPLKEMEFAYDELSGQAYIWDRGVGRVFTINMGDYSVQRIDRSFNHRNQFNHQAILKDSTIYAFGGYGYWSWKNYITYYNHHLKEWNVHNVSPESAVPEPRIPLAGTYHAGKDQMYIFGGSAPEHELRADDQYTVREILYDIWRFSFSDNMWDKIGDIDVEAEYYYHGSRYKRFSRINSISGSVFSSRSGYWYIPIVTEGRGDIIRLVPVNTETDEVHDPVLLEHYASDEFVCSNFLYDPSAKTVVMVGLRTVSGSDMFPVEVVTIPENRILSEIGKGEGIFLAIDEIYLITGGALVFLLALVLYIKSGSSGKQSDNTEDRSSIRERLLSSGWLKNEEDVLLQTLIRHRDYLESDQLEEKVWPGIDNYDYRRKLRNQTINSINKKFRRKFSKDEDLILRKKDPDDNRRYLYGLNEKFIQEQ